MPDRIYLCKKCGKEHSKEQLINGQIPTHCIEGSQSLCKVVDRAPEIKKD